MHDGMVDRRLLFLLIPLSITVVVTLWCISSSSAVKSASSANPTLGLIPMGLLALFSGTTRSSLAETSVRLIMPGATVSIDLGPIVLS